MTRRKKFGSADYWEQRNRVYERDLGRCQSPHCQHKSDYSVGDDWNLDHIVPISSGGTNDDTNLRVLCLFCHVCRDDPKHAKLKRRFIVTGRLTEDIIKKFLWKG